MTVASIEPDYQTRSRMALKRQAVPLPHLQGKRVLDVGCDMAFWSFLAAEQGAARVVGLDRNRDVRGRGHLDLVQANRAAAVERRCSDRVAFEEINLGKQWREYGRFDVALVMSVYHHIYENCGDHSAVWFWLSRHCATDAMVIWEGPTNDCDPVVRANVSDVNRGRYRLVDILAGAAPYFVAERVGLALHEPTREVWRFFPRAPQRRETGAVMLVGAGGAAPAFEYADGRRMNEIERVLGARPVPGSLNLRLDGPFDWDRGYYRAQILDVRDRSAGLESPWAPRWARFYPLTVDGEDAWAFRFEGERYDRHFMELIAPERLRDRIAGPQVTLCR